jgi:hypothetical protein
MCEGVGAVLWYWEVKARVVLAREGGFLPEPFARYWRHWFF